MSDVRVAFRGIRQVQSALKRVSDEAAKELKIGFRGIAEGVAGAIRAKVPKDTGRAASSVKARATNRGGSIAFGGSAAPYYPWLDFGGRVGRDKRIHRTFIKEGRYVYPTIKERQPQTIDEVEKLVIRVVKRENFDVK